ncbi:MAG TPA: hypothetical protein VFV19_19180 [Candidatus Polarisedimenticolaceae bacterium]|nr:hypothetical protein [Candidatus Polarisedimenticolaceae bacterium]
MAMLVALIPKLPASPLPEFKVGQCWALRADPKYRGAELVVVKIDPEPVLGEVIFVDIENLHGQEESPSTLSFIPVSRSALRMSVDRVTRQLPNAPIYLESQYRRWKTTYVEGKRFVVTEPLEELLKKAWP